MISVHKLVILVAVLSVAKSQLLLSTYEYFQDTEQLEGLVADNKEFRLNGKHIRIISGAIHYFRVHPELWRDRLRKLRATGANTVETYISWNLHEPRMAQFDFGEGGNDFSAFMDIRRFVQIAQEEDLLVILRPGPYICAEWEFGGFPSWLQRDPDMRLRDNYEPYLDRIKIYFDALLPQLVDLQFSKGGSIIMAQIENEYKSFNPKSQEYLQFIRDTFLDNGLDCLHFTCDNDFPGDGMSGTIPGLLQTANFKEDPDKLLSRLLEVQPDKPLMVMEYWTGWFTNWNESTGGSPPEQFQSVLETIFDKYNGSVNFYMFHGGTNFAFTAGGGNSGAEPPYKSVADITSYDYDAPLSEAGDYTLKYNLAADLIEKYEDPKLRRPLRPSQSMKTAYPTLSLAKYLSYEDIIERIPESQKVTSKSLVSMEMLPINEGNGQSYGYIVYRKNTTINSGDIYTASYPRDFAEILVDGELIDTGFTNAEPEYLYNNVKEFALNVSTNGQHVVDILIENICRSNWGTGKIVEHKGLATIHQSNIELNHQDIEDVEIIPLEFTGSWMKGLEDWRNVSGSIKAPCLIKSSFMIDETPTDTFLDMTSWHKGVAFVNDFNVGRYWKAGPQFHLYVPAPLLKTGENTITIFEQLEASDSIVFSDMPNIGIPSK